MRAREVLTDLVERRRGFVERAGCRVKESCSGRALADLERVWLRLWSIDLNERQSA
jgi:hypothetical protein